MTFAEACEQVAAAISANTRNAILDATCRDGDEQLADLRGAMRVHRFPLGSGAIDLRRLVQAFDARSRREGLHVVQGWDFVAHRFTDETSPVLLLDYCTRLPRREAPRATAALVLNHYFQMLISLLAVRAWDEGDANENLDQLAVLLDTLQSIDTDRRTVDDVETLFLLAVSYFHPDERCYATLLDKVLALDEAHRVRMAVPWAVMMSAHLRWGFRFMYRNDVGAMRDDNVVDYPWLVFAVATLARARVGGNSALAAPLLAGLAADPWAFRGRRPAILDSRGHMHSDAADWFAADGEALLSQTAAHGTAGIGYSPLAFSCNFPPNAAVAHVASSVEDGKRLPPLNALFQSQPEALAPELSARRLAERLTSYSTADPARLGAHGAPLVMYDPYEGVRAYNNVVRVLRA